VHYNILKIFRERSLVNTDLKPNVQKPKSNKDFGVRPHKSVSGVSLYWPFSPAI